jgi:glycosyltransferase involved in cell wall biosynthesis
VNYCNAAEVKVAMKVMKVHVDTPALFIRARTNTDWRYMRELRHISEFETVAFVYPFDLGDVARANIGFLTSKFGRLWGRRTPVSPSPRGLRIGRGVDIVYSHRRDLPSGLERTPLVWFHSVADPEMSRANGASEESIEAEYASQAVGYCAATKVQMTSDAEVARHRAKFPELADRFVCAPWFRPGLKATSLGDAQRKQRDDHRLRLAFVGRQARRKGLDIVMDALRLMSDAERAAMTLDVVTPFSDGPVDMSLDMDLRIHREIDERALAGLLRRAHVYVMPCRFETFGLVFVEAMSHGCAVIAPDWEVQREILEEGRAGLNARPTPEAVCEALRHLRQDASWRSTLVEAALDRFDRRYSPAAVAHAYHAMFQQALAR